MNISCSARKDWRFHIRDWIDFERSHAKIHGNIEFNYSDIDYIFGFTEEYSPLYGGRVASPNGRHELSITKVDRYWAYDHDIGIKIPLSSKTFSDSKFYESIHLLKEYHRKGNAIIVSNPILAERIRYEFPLYQIEASAIMDLSTIDKVSEALSSQLYNHIVLPIASNDDISLLDSIVDKEKIRLFINAECSYNCPNKVCYGTTGQKNSGKDRAQLCSHWDLELPRTWYNDEVDWGNFYFDTDKFKKLGYNNYKILPSWESQQQTSIMVDTRFRKGELIEDN